MAITIPREASRILLDTAIAPRGARALFINHQEQDDDSSGRTFENAKDTFQGVLEVAEGNDVIYVAPGGYDESVTVEESSLFFCGIAGRGAPFIEPSAEGGAGMHVLADDVTLENLGVAGEETADFSLKVGDQETSPARFRAKGCKFEGAPVILQGVGDVLFEDCEFAWEAALQFAANDNGFCTQVVVKNCRFHNITEEHIKSLASGGVRNLQLIDCVFDNAEDGTAPAKFLDIAEAGDTGIVTGCRFACATNEADVLAIAAGILFVGNYTESGPTTGRPS